MNLVCEVGSFLIVFITMPYISRVLGAEGVGIHSYTDSIAQYFNLFGNLGVLIYGQMEIAKCRYDKKLMSKTFYELCSLRAE